MIDPLVPALLVDIAVAAVGAVFVRAQLAIHEGFDISLAAIALLGGELMVAFVGAGGDPAVWAAAAIAAAGAGALLGGVWSGLLAAALGGHADRSARVLIASLGLATLASGGVGVARGPGIRQLVESGGFWILPGHFAMAGLLCAGGLATVLIWASGRAGFEASLLDQDREFARELGCGGRYIAVSSGLWCGAAVSLAGAARAVISGTSASAGMEMFLIAAAGALLLGRRGFRGAVLGAVIIASLHMAVLLIADPVWADFFVFGSLAMLLIFRGWDRTADKVR